MVGISFRYLNSAVCASGVGKNQLARHGIHKRLEGTQAFAKRFLFVLCYDADGKAQLMAVEQAAALQPDFLAAVFYRNRFHQMKTSFS